MPPARTSPKRANEVIWTGSPTLRAMIGYYVKYLSWATAAVAVIYLTAKAGALATWHVLIAALLIYGAVIGYGHLKRRTTQYTFTRSRVLLQEGVLNIRKEQALLAKVNNVIVERDLIDRILQIGTIEIETANDSDGSTLRLYGLGQPQVVENLLDDLRNDLDVDPLDDRERDPDLAFLDD